MHLHLFLKRSLQFQRCILILACISLIHLSETQAKGNGRLMLNGGLSKAICIAAEKYRSLNTIQKPLNDASKFPRGDESSCIQVKWNECESEVKCKKFECSSSLPRETKAMSSRIIGGTDALPHEFPYQIQFKKTKHYCGGTILNENYIISAAHCFYGPDGDITKYTVVGGEHNVRMHEGEEQERKIKRIIIHENYSETGIVKNDISIIELETKLELNPHVQSIVLPNANYEARGNVIVTGWGDVDGPAPDVLQKVTLPIVPHEVCVKVFQTNTIKDAIDATMLCAGILGVGGKDACDGDSGGPMAIKMENGSYLLVGIVSWGVGCGSPKYPGVYTNVAKFVDWIYKHATSNEDEC